MMNINIKKLIPGMISMIIIAGMAIQSFATNVDLEAFVDLDTYTEKFNELDFRIDDIDKELDRLYKFVCTNVATFAGSQPWGSSQHYVGGHYNNSDSAGYPTHYYSPVVDLSQDKWLRLGQIDFITYTASLYPANKFKKVYEYERPASLIRWREGIEPAPTCKVKVNIVYDGRLNNNSSCEIIMGPFKKFPNITTVGSGKTQCSICDIPRYLSWTFTGTEFYYAVNSEQEPTSWTSHSGRLTTTTVNAGATNSYYPYPTFNDVTDPNVGEESRIHWLTYMSTAMPNLSSYTNIWIKHRWSDTSNHFYFQTDRSQVNLTSWNVK